MFEITLFPKRLRSCFIHCCSFCIFPPLEVKDGWYQAYTVPKKEMRHIHLRCIHLDLSNLPSTSINRHKRVNRPTHAGYRISPATLLWPPLQLRLLQPAPAAQYQQIIRTCSILEYLSLLSLSLEEDKIAKSSPLCLVSHLFNHNVIYISSLYHIFFLKWVVYEFYNQVFCDFIAFRFSC